MPTPSATRSTLQVGTYAPAIDTWTQTLDLNDGATFYIHPGGITIDQPEIADVRSFNIRAPGERVLRQQYKNRHVIAEIWLRATPTSTTTLLASIHTLLKAIVRPPYRLRIAPPGAAGFSYADVVKCVHNIPADPQTILSGAIQHIKLDFECSPGFTADQPAGGTRHYLSNMLVNPGLEAPSGPGVPVFNDLLTNFNAYTDVYSRQVINDGAALYWRLDDTGTTATSLVGTGVGTLSGTGITTGATGLLTRDSDAAMLFTAANSGRITVTPSSPASISGTWTAEVWVSNGITGKILGSRGPSDGGMDIQYTGTTLQVALGNGTAFQQSINNTVALAAGSNHIAVVVTPTNVKIYLNGAQLGSTTVIAYSPLLYNNSGSHNFYIGHNGVGGDPYANGTIDEVALYATNLSAATILTHYQVGKQTLSLTQDTFRYPDTVLADAPLHYYRLDEVSGTTFYDATGSGQNGTLNGGVTQNAASLLTGDTDPAATFNGTTGYIQLPNAGTWPTGNGAWTLECWCKPTNSTNAANATLVAIGNPGTTAAAAEIAQTSTGGWTVATWGGAGHDFNGNGTSTAGSTYHVVATYDGTNLRLYVNNTLFGPFTPSALNLSASHQSIGDSWNGSIQTLFFPGVIDEVAIYGTALSAARVSAHYTAGTTTPTTTSNTMVVPANTSLQFGSPAWSSINLWQVRFRYLTGLTATFFAHYTDANNYLAATVTGTALTLVHVVAGVTNTLNTQAMQLTNGMQYYLQTTQFPAIDTFPQAQIQAVIRPDTTGGNSFGTPLATAGPIALSSNSVANSGQPQIQAAGAALGIGGNFGGGIHLLELFGPGGWTYTGASGGGGTSIASGAWEQNTANTYPNGPVTSFGALRMDAPATGTWYGAWLSLGLNSGGTAAANLAPAAPSQTIQGAIWVKTSGLNSTATIQLIGVDCDINGGQLRSTTIATLTGNQSGWVQLSGSWVTGAGTAYVELNPVAFDGTTSPSATVWFDNAQMWNQTATGQSTMPYCELRMPQAPAQLLVSGLLGDMVAPAYLAFGTWFASWPNGSNYLFGFARRAQVSTGLQAAGNLQVFLGVGTGVLDATAYGGYYIASQTAQTSVQFDPPLNQTVSAIAGTWQYFTRAKTTQATVANVSVQLSGFDKAANHAGQWYSTGATIAPMTAANVWQAVNQGLLTFPLGSAGAITPNPASVQERAISFWADSTGGGSQFIGNWYAYFPVDANLLYGMVLNPSGAATQTNVWQWAYADALGPIAQTGIAWKYSTEATALPNPTLAIGGTGVASALGISVNPVADQALTLDPLINANTNGVNQIVALLADNNAAVQSVACEIIYAPLYLYPK